MQTIAFDSIQNQNMLDIIIYLKQASGKMIEYEIRCDN